jgi:hypothetical protein
MHSSGAEQNECIHILMGKPLESGFLEERSRWNVDETVSGFCPVADFAIKIF